MSSLSGPLLCACLLSAAWATARPGESEAVDPCSHGMTMWGRFQDSIRLAGGAKGRLSRNIQWVGRDVSGLDTYCGETLPAARDFFRQRVEEMNCSPSQRAALSQLARDTGYWCEPDSGQVNPDIQYVIDWINDHEEDEVTGPGRWGESSCPGRVLHYSCQMTALDAAGWSEESRHSPETAPIQQLSHEMQTIVSTMIECMVLGARDGCPIWRRDILQTLLSDQTISILALLGVNMTFNHHQLVDMFQLSVPPREYVDDPVLDDVITL